MTGISYERVYATRVDELRRQAYVAAQIRQAPRRPLARLAKGLRSLAARLERSGEAFSGPWHRDFEPVATWDV